MAVGGDGLDEVVGVEVAVDGDFGIVLGGLDGVVSVAAVEVVGPVAVGDEEGVVAVAAVEVVVPCAADDRVAVVVAGYFLVLPNLGRSVQAVDVRDLTGDAKRGAYLAVAAGCLTCHTDYKKKGKLLAGGQRV